MEWKKNDSHFCLLMVFQSPVWRSIWSGTCQADGPDLISPFTRNCRPGFIIHGQPARLSVNSQYMPWFVLNSKTTSEVEKWIKILKRCTWSMQFCEFNPMYNVTVNTSKNAIQSSRWCSVIKAWNQNIYFFCNLKFESCDCLYDSHWRLTWSLTSGSVGLVKIRVSCPEHPR
jgi:hypothetical protein